MSNETFVQPKLSDLLASYLQRQADTQAAGIATFDGEVTPYEVGPVQPLDPKLAWDESLAVLPLIASAPTSRVKAPPHWSHLVAHHESIVAVAFCAANFPQLMRNFQQILTKPNLAEMRPTPGRPTTATDLSTWQDEVAKRKSFPEMLLVVGALRLAKHFDAADIFLRTHDASVPSDWRAAWDNEKAALAWHRGRHDEARKLWDAQAPSVPVLFNRGMAALFAGDNAGAKQHLTAAVAKLPAIGAWHHLGRLYLTLAELQR